MKRFDPITRLLVACVCAIFLAGCTGHGLVPAGAEKLQSGHGTLTATAPDGGRIYVVDHDTDKVIYSGRVHDGDRVRVDADNDKIQVADTTTEANLSHDHRYEIYFKK